jgi:hypothetical protein
MEAGIVNVDWDEEEDLELTNGQKQHKIMHPIVIMSLAHKRGIKWRHLVSSCGHLPCM